MKFESDGLIKSENKWAKGENNINHTALLIERELYLTEKGEYHLEYLSKMRKHKIIKSCIEYTIALLTLLFAALAYFK